MSFVIAHSSSASSVFRGILSFVGVRICAKKMSVVPGMLINAFKIVHSAQAPSE